MSDDDKGLALYAESVAGSAAVELHLPPEHVEAVRCAIEEAVKMGARAQQRVFEEQQRAARNAAPVAAVKPTERADIQRIERLREAALQAAQRTEQTLMSMRLQLAEREEELALQTARLHVLDGLYDHIMQLAKEEKK